MSVEEKRYIVGIDLGTTNCAVSYVDLLDDDKAARARLFKVPQLTGAGEVTRLSVLPSFLYIPGRYDLSEADVAMMSDPNTGNFVGSFARDQGARVPSRLVSSAKSWLCHSGADRTAAILPWGSGGDVRKVSPVQATAAYLSHIRQTWNTHFGDDDTVRLENQHVTVTVPASFDEAARELTVQAAKMAGLPEITLLEEPLAAFYAWLMGHEHTWADHVTPGELILVCDVGGGTTDFTLITLREAEGGPRFERIAVGDHLILGGDNVDLALARLAESRFSGKKGGLTAEKYKSLCHQCRQAKEEILGGKTDRRKVTLMGEGSNLIGGTLSADLTREMVEQTVVEGFFPLVKAEDPKAAKARMGITEFGLPYEQEPAITRHLGWFVMRNAAEVASFLGRERCMPDLILFNGGSLKPDLIQERIREGVRHWFNEPDERLPRVMENPDPDLAVALGASYYGLVKMGRGVRVGSGSPRSFYLGVAVSSEKGQGGEAEPKAICLVERGMQEGSRIELPDRRFEVLANQPVGFDLYSSSFRSGDRTGDLLNVDDTLTALPPLQTVIQYGKKGGKTRLPVRVEAHFTEMGTLGVWCRSENTDHRWKLSFQLRAPESELEIGDTEVLEEGVKEAAVQAVTEAFSDKTATTRLESLVKEVSDIAGHGRDKWPAGLIRAMADALIHMEKVRRFSPVHEARWLNLTGFCMRPGFGDGPDPHRMKNIWKLFKPGPVFDNNAQVKTEWWIFWRRTAGGLSAGQQRQFIQELNPVLLSGKGKKAKFGPQELVEIQMAVGNMERLLVKDKVAWGRYFLSLLHPKKSKPQFLWALSRLGARKPLYGPADRVIPPKEAEKWLNTLLSVDWKNPRIVAPALAWIARKTGDRTRDVSPDAVQRVLQWLGDDPQFENLRNMVSTVREVETAEKSLIFGESLPTGIVLEA